MPSAMASARRKFVVRLHLIGVAAALILTVVVVFILRGVVGPGDTDTVVEGSLTFLLIALIVEQLIGWQVRVRILGPAGRAADVASRVAEGDLSMTPGGTARATSSPWRSRPCSTSCACWWEPQRLSLSCPRSSSSSRRADT